MISNRAPNPSRRPTNRILVPGVLSLVLILLSAPIPSIATENLDAGAANPCLLYGSVELPSQEAQLFTIDVKTNATSLLGSTVGEADISGLAVHPDTMELYALQVNQRGRKVTSLMSGDTDTGALGLVGSTGFDHGEGLSFRPGDNTLWAWWRGHGLVQIDPATAAYSLVYPGDLPISDLAWDAQGEVLYLAGNRTLWSYTADIPGFELVQEPLPLSIGGIAARSDGRLVLTPANTVTSGIDLLVFDPAAGNVVAEYGVPALPNTNGRSKGEAAAFVQSLAWPLRCGNISPGGPGELIQSVQIDPTQLCSGDTTVIQVAATHPEGGDNPVLISIDGMPGAQHTMQIEGPPGPRYVSVFASTADGYVDGETLELEVLDCGPERSFVRLSVGMNNLPYTADFLVANAAEIAPEGAEYAWDFGDGLTEVTTVPFISHSYEEELSADQEYLSFLVTVTVQLPDATSLQTSTTVSVWNDYAAGREKGLIQPLLSYEPELLSTETGLVGEYRLRNLEAEPILLTQRRVDLQPCDSNLAAEPAPWEAISTVIGPGEVLTDSLILDAASVDEQACGVELHLTGQSGRLQVAADLYFHIKRDPSSLAPVADIPTLALLNDIAARGLVADPDNITDEDLYVLANQGLVTIPPSAAATATESQLSPAIGAAAGSEDCDSDPKTPNPIGCPCERGDLEPSAEVPPNVGRLTCQATEEFDRYPAHLPNALKGDVILVGGCGVVGEMLLSIDQRFQHTGIMTRNYTEIAHSTSTAEVAKNHKETWVGPTFWPHIDEEVLKYGWPGIIRSDIGTAFSHLELEDPHGDVYLKQDFRSEPSSCAGVVVPPLVVKPPPDKAQAVRPLLSQAADIARDMATPTDEWETNGYDGTGHYRFYAYTDSSIASNSSYDHPPSEPATSCSTFVWHVLTEALKETDGVTLEGPSLELTDLMGDGTLWEVGDHDGLYLYPEHSRRMAAQFLWHKTFDMVMETSWFDLVFQEAARFIANQIVNCFISDDCSKDAALHDDWQKPGVGNTVSPANILLWDQPTDDDSDGTFDHGVYGYSERLVFRSGGFERVYRWMPSKGTGSVSGVVRYNDGTPASEATVILDADGGLETLSDPEGRFEFLSVSAGDYGIEAQKQMPDDRFLSSRHQVVHVEKKNVSEIELVLMPPEEDFRLVSFAGTYLHYDYEWGNFCTSLTTSMRGGDVTGLACRVDPYCEQPTDGYCNGDFSWDHALGDSTLTLSGSCQQRAYVQGEPLDLSVKVEVWGAIDGGNRDNRAFTLEPGGSEAFNIHAENRDWCLLLHGDDYGDFSLEVTNNVQD